MNKTAIIGKATRLVNRAGLKVKKYSPELLIGVGVVGVVAGAVMACKATLKVNEVLEQPKEDIEKIHIAHETGVTDAGETYTEDDYKKDTAIVYTKTGLKFVKLYGPAVLVGAASVGCILAGNGIMRKRNVALAAAYATIDKSFKEYRGRVVERFGKELDKELKYNIKAMKIEEVITDENGKEKKVKKTVEAVDPNTISAYARFYDDGCIGWDKDPELNLFTLLQIQNHANDQLKARGHLFLNEVYDMLGIPRTKAGNQVGWYFDEEHPTGDNYVDFGIHDLYNEKKRDFVNGYERVVLLDFNVDGVILNYI